MTLPSERRIYDLFRNNMIPSIPQINTLKKEKPIFNGGST